MLNRALKISLLVGVFSLVLLVCLINQATAQSETLVVVFKWSFKGFSWEHWKAELPRQVYDYYDSLSATELLETYTLQLSSGSRIWDYKYFATWQEKSIEELAKALEVAANSRYDYYDKAGFILAFVQSIPYTPAQERPRFPIETLVEGGVCSDKSILYATLMIVLRYDVVFLHFPGNTHTRGSHLAVGVWGSDYSRGTCYVYNGNQYYYCETTKPGWKFGEIPSILKNKSVYVFDSYCSQPIPEFPQDHVLVIATFVSITLVLTRIHNTQKTEKPKRETGS